MLNGSRTDGRPAFRNNSYFATFELPNLQRTGPYRVTKINALLLHDPDQKVVYEKTCKFFPNIFLICFLSLLSERCGENSMSLMENLIRSYQFNYTCTNNPEELILIMCGDAWDARECQVARQVLREQWHKKVYGISSAYSHSLSMVLLSIVLFIYSLSRSAEI